MRPSSARRTRSIPIPTSSSEATLAVVSALIMTSSACTAALSLADIFLAVVLGLDADALDTNPPMRITDRACKRFHDDDQ